MCKSGTNRNPWTGYQNGLPPPNHSPPNLSKLEVGKSPFQIAVKRAEIDENVNRARSIRHFFLALNVCLEVEQSSQLSERRLNAICVVVERHDHHCVDDLVLRID